MALIWNNSRCAICEELLGSTRPFFATSGVFPVPRVSLRYCDAPLHWDCYAVWPHRRVFAEAYVRMWIKAEEADTAWFKVLLDEFSFVTVNPEEPDSEISIRLFATGSDFRVKLADWEQWLGKQFAKAEGEHPVEQDALAAALPSLLMQLPTTEAIMGRIDKGAKQALEKSSQEKYERYAATQRAILQSSHNRACADAAKLQLSCPYCNEGEILSVDGGEVRKSYFQCRCCGRTFWPEDLKRSPV